MPVVINDSAVVPGTAGPPTPVHDAGSDLAEKTDFDSAWRHWRERAERLRAH